MGFKFDKIKTEQLIRLKHSDKFMECFKLAEGNPKSLKSAWKELSNEINPDLNYMDTKAKYNQLLSKFKVENIESKKSGSGCSTWKYWNVFNETFSKNQDFTMPNVIELGNSSEVTPSDNVLPEPQVYKPPKRQKLAKSDYYEKKLNVLNALEVVIKNETSDRKENEQINSKISNLTQKLENIEFVVNEVNNYLAQILKNQKKE